MFHQSYQLTDSRHDLQPCSVIGSAKSMVTSPTVGTYNLGLFTIIDENTSHRLLASWSWLVRNEAIAFMTTGLGDLFFWKPEDGIHFLCVQRAEVEFVHTDLSWFFEDFMLNPHIIDAVLCKPLLNQLVRMYQPLQYGETFILEPWLMLGGQDKPENYDIGACDVYLDLVGQTHRMYR